MSVCWVFNHTMRSFIDEIYIENFLNVVLKDGYEFLNGYGVKSTVFMAFTSFDFHCNVFRWSVFTSSGFQLVRRRNIGACL